MTRDTRISICSTLALGALLFATACSDSTSPTGNNGTLVTRLTDAPFPTDQVKSVDVFVVRVDARQTDVTDADANTALDDQSSATSGWKTVARPNKSFDLLSLQNGIAATLGQANLPAGTYSGFRFVIDQSKSSATLKDGTVLSGGSVPGIKFPSAGQSGIKILLADPVKIVANTETDLLVDFDVGQSFVLRGNTIDKNGLLFKPVISASVTNLALTNSNVRLANATGGGLDLLRSGSVLPGASNITFGTSSACSSVSAATPSLAIATTGTATLLPGFSPTLIAGHPFTFVAYPGSGSAVQFATIEQGVPVSGQQGLLVFNATSIATALDVYVTAPGAPLGSATVSNVAAGTASASTVSVP
ncbi:MAG TPA: DUF4382 domain-containing protein, partial [Gemmatimonadaceae bacterium]|nr:DUF4382 domain-containing protein [Gemmatimonadaceae bacterium]